MSKHEPDVPTPTPETSDRRSFLEHASTVIMGVGLVAGYGVFGGMAGKFLYPAASARQKRWVFVNDLASFAPGKSMTWRTPGGAPVVIARHGATGKADDFIALSSTCPHLGCQVHFEPQNNRFFCPCHNGTFDSQGVATGGPPKQAGQSLLRFSLKVDAGLLYIELGEELTANAKDRRPVKKDGAPSGPGQDPCLFERPNGEWV